MPVHRPLVPTTAGLLTLTAAAVIAAPAALAAPASSSAPGTRPTVGPTEMPATPSLSATPVPARTAGPGSIDVPAGRADVSANSTGDDVLVVGLACGVALLVASGAVVIVARRSR